MLCWYTDWQLSEHKFLEIECHYMQDFNDWFRFDIHWSRKGDHAGFESSFDIVGLYGTFHIYDHRHWDYVKDCWNS